MATVFEQSTSIASTSDNVPQWKKDLIARLRNQNKKHEERLLWIDHHPPHHHHHTLQAHHPHPKTELVCPLSPENGFGKDRQSPESSDSEDLHYGPGIVNKLRNKYLSLALRESNSRPTILRKATSLENLLDEDEEDEGEKDDGRLFRRRGGGNDGGSHFERYRSSNRRQEMKRARSVEAISRTNHDDEMTMTSSVTAKINNRQSLHEEMLIANNLDKPIAVVDNTRSYKKAVSIENGAEDSTNKYNGRINRPRRIPPLLNEREKPPVDVVKQAKLIFEKKPETRTKKPPQTGDVAAKVDSFNNIIVKSKSATKVAKPPIKSSKPVLNDKLKNNTQHHVVVRPAAKPVILNEEVVKPKSLDLKGSKSVKKDFSSLPSPIPDVSRVDIKSQDGSDPRNSMANSLCETPDLILTSSPIPKITSPTYRKRSTQSFIEEERNSSFLPGHTEATNKYLSPVHSPTKPYTKPTSLNFNKEELDALGMKMISPISQKNITKNSASSVFNFINSQVDQNHLPPVNKNVSEQTVPVSEPLKIEVNGFGGVGKPRMGLSAFELEKNQRNVAKSSLDRDKDVEDGKKEKSTRMEDKTGKSSNELTEVFEKVLKPVVSAPSGSSVERNRAETVGRDVISTQINEVSSSTPEKERKKWPPPAEKSGTVLETHNKTGKSLADTWENRYKQTHSSTVETSLVADKSKDASEKTEESISSSAATQSPTDTVPEKVVTKTLDKPEEVAVVKNAVKTPKDVDKIERGPTQPQNKSASAKSATSSSGGGGNGGEEGAVKMAFQKKPKPRVEETTTSIFNFTGRKDVPDYISNDKSRSASRIVLPKPDEPGIKLLPEALLVNFKEIQEVWEEDELIRSLEARPPSPCDVTFINDNVLIDGKSCFVQRNPKRVKLKISFIDDADIYEYPSETSLLIEESPLPSPMGSNAQVGHTVPSLSGSSLATYTPKTTETFQLGITKTFHDAPATTSKPDVTKVDEAKSDVVLEEIEQPMLFSSGGTSDILF